METTYLQRLINDQRQEFLSKKTGTPREVAWNDLLNLGRIIAITGIRRCGKSTLLRQIAEDVNGGFVYLNFDDIRLSGFSESDYEVLITIFSKQRKEVIYLFDEIQLAPVWERFLRRMHDNGANIVVTGSNSSLLSNELGSHLTGRYLKQELFPFSFSESLTHFNLPQSVSTTAGKGLMLQKSFEYTESGGFPEYLTYQRRELLEQLFKDILIRDIIARHGIQEKQRIQDLALYLMSNPGAKISYGKLARRVGFKSHTSVKEFLGYMEDVYLLFQVRKFDWSLKRSMLAPRKVYPVDQGLSNAIAFKISPNRGHMLETAVFIQLLGNSQVWYFEGRGECDFVQKNNNGKYDCVQVCWHLSDDNREREFTGLCEAMEFFQRDSGIIITYDQEEIITLDQNRTVTVIPFWKWATSSGTHR